MVMVMLCLQSGLWLQFLCVRVGLGLGLGIGLIHFACNQDTICNVQQDSVAPNLLCPLVRTTVSKIKKNPSDTALKVLKKVLRDFHLLWNFPFLVSSCFVSWPLSYVCVQMKPHERLYQEPLQKTIVASHSQVRCGKKECFFFFPEGTYLPCTFFQSSTQG